MEEKGYCKRCETTYEPEEVTWGVMIEAAKDGRVRATVVCNYCIVEIEGFKKERQVH